jgi:hypothetical protein
MMGMGMGHGHHGVIDRHRSSIIDHGAERAQRAVFVFA